MASALASSSCAGVFAPLARIDAFPSSFGRRFRPPLPRSIAAADLSRGALPPSPRGASRLRRPAAHRPDATGTGNAGQHGYGAMDPGQRLAPSNRRRRADGSDEITRVLPSSRQRADGSDDFPRIAPSTPSRAESSGLWNVLRGVAVGILLAIGAVNLVPGAAHAAAAKDSIGASSLGLRVAEYLRGFGLADEWIIVTVAALPVLELRGAIPVAYWLRMAPARGYALAVLGNMAPVPFIVLYLERLSKWVGERSGVGRRVLQWLFEGARRRAGPIEEFRWLGLMLFVAVPLPGTGAWTGAIAASILGIPFWDAVSANLVGVLLAGLLVNLLVSVGAHAACLVGLAILAASLFMWSALRAVQRKRRA